MINKEWFLLLLGLFLVVTTYLVVVIKDYRNFRHLMFKLSSVTSKNKEKSKC